MKQPLDALCMELARAGYHIPLTLLHGCLERADIRLVQSQRPAVEAHLAEVEKLSRTAWRA